MAQVASAPAQPARTIERGAFRFTYDERGVSGLMHPRDPYGAVVVPVAARPGQGGGERGGGRGSAPGAGTLGMIIAYRTGAGAWTQLTPRTGGMRTATSPGDVVYESAPSDALKAMETFRTDGRVLDWTIDLVNTGTVPVTVGDFAINIPVNTPTGQDPKAIFERGFLRHHFVSGDGSFFFYTRASGAPPFLLVTVRPGTRLEYQSGGGRGGGAVFVHSERSGNEVQSGTWRQQHTSLTLAPRATAQYGFRMQWADSYDEMREILYHAGLFDIRVVPGMTLPSDLTARFALHTRERIDSIAAEHPDHTTIRSLGESRPGYHIYEVQFRRLGENLLTIHHDGGRSMHLEFFSTEPLETLIKKRAAFLVTRQQIRDSTKWWNGVFGPYDMRAQVTRTIEDPDIFLGRMVYVLTCDDPGLSKAPLTGPSHPRAAERVGARTRCRVHRKSESWRTGAIVGRQNYAAAGIISRPSGSSRSLRMQISALGQSGDRS